MAEPMNGELDIQEKVFAISRLIQPSSLELLHTVTTMQNTNKASERAHRVR